MSNPAASTHERILQQGLALMSQAGGAGVTRGVPADQVGMSKSGRFAHFRSKEDVQIGLLQHMAQVATAQVVRPAMRADEGLPRLQALVQNRFGWAQRAGLPGGCPVAAGLFEFDDTEGAVRNEILAMERQWRGLLKQPVRQASDWGHLRPDLDGKQFVWELCGFHLIHHVAPRFLRTADADRRASTTFQVLLDRARPPPGRRKVTKGVK